MQKPDHTSHKIPLINVAVLAAVAMIVCASGYGYYVYQTRYVIAEARHDLSTIANLKASQIVDWRKERYREAEAISSNPAIAHRIKHYLDGNEKERAFAEIRSWLESIHNRTAYHKVILFRTDGDVITALMKNPGPLPRHYRDNVRKTVNKGEVTVFDLHIDDESGTMDIDTLIPIMYSSNNSTPTCIAVLGIDINPHMQLFPLVRTWPSPSRTGETVLVRRDGDHVLFLNELRLKSGSALRDRMPLTLRKLPAVMAVEGKEGEFEGLDYRGVRVLAATRSIHDSPWSIVCKVDIEEVLEPVAERVWYVAGTCLTIIIALGLAISLWGKKQQELFLRKQYDAEHAFNSELMAADQALQEANTLLEQRVADRTHELFEINAKLREEIEERRLLQNQLVESKKLESIGQLAGGVAHEVRNPLNAILSVTEALFRETAIEDNKEFEPYIHHIRTQVSRLAQLMNDLLELGKSISPANLCPVPLNSLCRETIELWEASGAARKIPVKLISLSASSQLYVVAYGLRLQQVLFNLLENAAQHSPDTAIIELQLIDPQDMSDSVCIRVVDSGCGIPNESLPRIFEPFFTNRKDGTGLGLALVRHFMLNMGGTVIIYNNDPPPGCTAEINIPLAYKEPA